MNVSITQVTTHNIKSNNSIDEAKLGNMLDEMKQNPTTCSRVPLVRSSCVELMKLYVDPEYTIAVAYDYPFMSFDVFSTNNKERQQILFYIQNRHDKWKVNGLQESLKVSQIVEDNLNLYLPFGVAFLLYTFVHQEPKQIKFNPVLLRTDIGISDSFLCGCIRCVKEIKNPVWDIYKLTNQQIIDHRKSDVHQSHIN